MIFYTVQPKEIIDKINKDGKFICDIEKSELIEKTNNNDCFYRSYTWLVEKMNKKIENKNNIQFPIWAWYKRNGTNDYPNLNELADKDNLQYLIKLDVPEKNVVLTDFSIWHAVLNNFPWIDADTDEEFDKKEKEFNLLHGEEYKKAKEKTWETMFVDPINDNKYVQATFWEMTKDMILDIQEIQPSIDLSEIEECIKDEDFEFLKEHYNLSKDTIASYINYYIENERNTYIKKNNIASEFDLIEKDILSKETKSAINTILNYINKEQIKEK